MVNDSLEPALSQALLAAYGSWSRPNLPFVLRTIDKDPYASLIRQLSGDFEVAENTDENYDFSFSYILSQGVRRWWLRLSMVGPYAALLQLPMDGGRGELVTQDAAGEPRLVGALEDHNIRLLSRRQLAQTIELQLPESSGLIPLYRALFEDTDSLPWAMK